jgi:23S rRNA (cytosine1962-C5)-methyltransferase
VIGIPACPLRLKKGVEENILRGMPWIYASDIIDSSELLMIPSGSVVTIENHKGQYIGVGYYNAKSQIACRVLSLERETINVDFFLRRFEKALALRQRSIDVPYYRFIHSESDGLPGLLIDRFDEVLVVQVGTAGMEYLQPLWVEALERHVKPRAIILRNDTASRLLEGLNREVKTVKGEVSELAQVQENGCIYLADLLHGQKTGWFFDQRDNRKMIAELSKDKTVIDVYSHSGGFGVLAAKHGGAKVTMVDSSKLALGLAQQAVLRNGITTPCEYIQGDAFEVMERLRKESKIFDIVLADPPAFVKTKKDIAAGLKGYEKVARMAAALVKPGGLLFVASCSHHAGRSAFNKAVISGVNKCGFECEILEQTSASADHPRHGTLPQSEYLKGLLLKLAKP